MNIASWLWSCLRSRTLVVGVFLSVFGVLAAWYVTRTDSPPDSTPSVGIATSFETQPYAGLVTRVVVRARGCSNPVRVSVALAGTSEVWGLPDNRMLNRQQAVAVVASGGAVGGGRIDPANAIALI